MAAKKCVTLKIYCSISQVNQTRGLVITCHKEAKGPNNAPTISTITTPNPSIMTSDMVGKIAMFAASAMSENEENSTIINGAVKMIADNV